VVFASRTELRAWLETKQGAEAARDREADEAVPVDADVRPTPTGRSGGWRRWAGLAVVGLALVGVSLWYAGAFQIRQRSLPAPKPLASTLLLRLTSADGTWSVVGIPVGGMAMSTQVGNSALVLSAVRDGDVSHIHVSAVAQGAGGRVEALSPAVVLALRQGEAVTPSEVPGLARVEWLADSEFSRLAPRQTGRAR